ncbi:MAG: hypothetical protein WBG92_01735 [Thiohalocapsa sp.]
MYTPGRQAGAAHPMIHGVVRVPAGTWRLPIHTHLGRRLMPQFRRRARQQVLKHPLRFLWRVIRAFQANQGMLLSGAVTYR